MYPACASCEPHILHVVFSNGVFSIKESPATHQEKCLKNGCFLCLLADNPRELSVSGGDCQETSELPWKWNMDPNIYIPCPSICSWKVQIKESTHLVPINTFVKNFLTSVNFCLPAALCKQNLLKCKKK